MILIIKNLIDSILIIGLMNSSGRRKTKVIVFESKCPCSYTNCIQTLITLKIVDRAGKYKYIFLFPSKNANEIHI